MPPLKDVILRRGAKFRQPVLVIVVYQLSFFAMASRLSKPLSIARPIKSKPSPSCPPLAFSLFTGAEREAELTAGFPFKACRKR